MVATGKIEEMIKEVATAFTISSSELQQMVVDFHAEMRRGLRGESGSLKMLPAFVDCSTGQEQGHVYWT